MGKKNIDDDFFLNEDYFDEIDKERREKLEFIQYLNEVEFYEEPFEEPFLDIFEDDITDIFDDDLSDDNS